jgi:hypothetical protein
MVVVIAFDSGSFRQSMRIAVLERIPALLSSEELGRG